MGLGHSIRTNPIGLNLFVYCNVKQTMETSLQDVIQQTSIVLIFCTCSLVEIGVSNQLTENESST